MPGGVRVVVGATTTTVGETAGTRAMIDRATVLVAVADEQDRERLVDVLDGIYDVTGRPADSDDLPSFDLCLGDHDALTNHHETLLDRKHDAGGVFLPCLFLRDDPAPELPDWELATVDDVLPLSASAEELLDRLDSLLDHRARTVALAEEKRRELRQQEALTEAAIEALPDLFYVFEPDGTLRRWNSRAGEITGYDDDELAGMDTLSFLPEPERDRIGRATEAALRGGDSYTVEAPLVTRDGETIPYEWKVAPIEHGEGLTGGVGIGRDITDRQMRQELARQNERLDQFASIVSHDLRNPIAVANGFLDLASQECESPHLDRVDGALDRMAALIDDLLALARQGVTVDEPEATSLTTVATSAWATVDSAAARLDLDTERDLLADPPRLQQLLENLFRNCVEHGGETVTVAVGDTGEGFYVADDGPGIPADQHEGVFEYGYTTSDEGTGFGLAIVRQITEAHGWSVSVTESESGGARFEFTGVDRPLDD